MGINEKAVDVQDLKWGYGNVPVIGSLSMSITKGTIYGLLGPSGCGKTTLLKILIGRLIPTVYKNLHVLGDVPGKSNHIIPGPSLGYSPQETALYEELSIKETFEFHGNLQGMEASNLHDKMSWLISFLELPDPNRLVTRLSGGQKRRLSLAVALLHEPELLILDEPTVGVDPLMRYRIWDYLRSITQTGVTVIVTTHYIEEARQADRVGLMRHGRLLDEGHPQTLLAKYNLTTLEDVFLYLCRGVGGREDGMGDIIDKSNEMGINVVVNESKNSSNGISQSQSNLEKGGDVYLSTKPKASEETPLLSKKVPKPRSRSSQSFSISKRKATQIRRNLILLFFELLTPVVEIFLFFTCVGPNPHNLDFAIVNADVGIRFGNTYVNIGNTLTDMLKTNPTLDVRLYPDMNEALDSVRMGTEWGVLYIPTNFTQALPERLTGDMNPDIIDQGSLHLQLDMSNYQVALTLQQTMLSTVEELAAQNNFSINVIEIGTPIFGSKTTKFGDFLAPGMIGLVVFAHSIGLTAIAFVRERLDGSLDRIFAAGVTSGTVIIGHFLTATLLLLTQTTLLLLLSIFGFNIYLASGVVSLLYVILFIILLGLAGMSLGLVISSTAHYETEAVQLSLASFFPALLLSGVMWPVESIPHWFAWLSKSLPTTWTAEALRSVMIRGWGIQYKTIWMALIITASWSVVLLFLASQSLREKDYEYGVIKRTLRKLSGKK